MLRARSHRVDRAASERLGLRGHLGVRLGAGRVVARRVAAAILAGGQLGLGQGSVGVVGIWQTAKRAAARQRARRRLSPALALDGHPGRAQVLLELVAAGRRVVARGGAGLGVIVDRGASVWQSALAPGLRRVLVLGRAELTSRLGLLLQSLLLLRVREANLDLKLLTAVVDRVVVERLDDLLADIAALEAVRLVSGVLGERQEEASNRAKPTPRPWPFLSLRMRAEHTLCGANRLPISCSFIPFGRLDT